MQDITNINLLNLNCKNYSKNDPVLTPAEISKLLIQTPGWEIHYPLEQTDQTYIYKNFKFKDYYQTIAFVNAIAWLVHQQDHHPQMTVDYNTLQIRFSTHSINGLSLNDFICAAKINNIPE